MKYRNYNDLDWNALFYYDETSPSFNVRVFGSVARGEETENSDVDFLIDYDIKKISPWFPAGLIGDLS